MEIGAVLGATAEYAITLVAMAIGFLAVAYLYEPYWKVRHVPGPVPLPLIGHLHLLAMHGLDVFSVLARKYGPVFRQPLVMVADAELCKEVGVKKFKSMPNRSIPSPITNSPVHQKGLFFTRGSRWTAMRNIILSIYQPSHLASLIPAMESCIERAAENLDGKEEIDFSRLSLSFTTDVIGQAAFGTDFGMSKKTASSDDDTDKITADTGVEAKSSSEFIRMHVHATTSLKMDMSGSLSIIIDQLVPFLHEPFRQVLKRISADSGPRDRPCEPHTRETVGQNRRRMGGGNGARHCNHAVAQGLPVRRAHGEGVEQIFEGAAHSGLHQRAHLRAPPRRVSHDGVHSLHGALPRRQAPTIDGFGPRDRVPMAEDLQTKFPYLDQAFMPFSNVFTLREIVEQDFLTAHCPFSLVVKESMRLYPSSPLIAREADERIEIGGYALRKGTWVWMAPGVLAKDPTNFPEPEVFRPEHFDPNGEEEKRRHPYALFPFGIGPRVCIGQKFAIQEIRLAAIRFYRHYVFRHSPSMESPPAFVFSIVSNFKNGVKLQVIRRRNA
uniref:Thromboxane-A synthase n=1 Tax=Leersia perrieri TaxID=77586 RepID=A0A0D9V4M4_9ORYZ